MCLSAVNSDDGDVNKGVRQVRADDRQDVGRRAAERLERCLEGCPLQEADGEEDTGHRAVHIVLHVVIGFDQQRARVPNGFVE